MAHCCDCSKGKLLVRIKRNECDSKRIERKKGGKSAKEEGEIWLKKGRG